MKTELIFPTPVWKFDNVGVDKQSLTDFVYHVKSEDPAGRKQSNNGGWQWSSSTGTDAAPYFRIFNPLTQSKNFDSNGLFIKKYINELKDLDKKDIHDPDESIRNHLNYPSQMLDLKESRLRAIDAFNEAKNT